MKPTVVAAPQAPAASAEARPRGGVVVVGAVAGALSGTLSGLFFESARGLGENLIFWVVPAGAFVLVVGGAMSVASRTFRREAVGWMALVLAAWFAQLLASFVVLEAIGSMAVGGGAAVVIVIALVGGIGGAVGGALFGLANSLVLHGTRGVVRTTMAVGALGGALIPFVQARPLVAFLGVQAVLGTITGLCLSGGGEPFLWLGKWLPRSHIRSPRIARRPVGGDDSA